MPTSHPLAANVCLGHMLGGVALLPAKNEEDEPGLFHGAELWLRGQAGNQRPSAVILTSFST